MKRNELEEKYNNEDFISNLIKTNNTSSSETAFLISQHLKVVVFLYHF
jgi:hypothetical protein